MMHEIPVNQREALVALDNYIRCMSTLDDRDGFFAKPEWVKLPAQPIRAWEVTGCGSKATVYLFKFAEPRLIGQTLQTGYALATGVVCAPYHWFGGDGEIAAELAAQGVVRHV